MHVCKRPLQPKLANDTQTGYAGTHMTTLGLLKAAGETSKIDVEAVKTWNPPEVHFRRISLTKSLFLGPQIRPSTFILNGFPL